MVGIAVANKERYVKCMKYNERRGKHEYVALYVILFVLLFIIFGDIFCCVMYFIIEIVVWKWCE